MNQEDPRKADVLKMLASRCTMADIMEKHRISHTVIRKWRRDADLPVNSTGPRPVANEPTTDHDRVLFHKQQGLCFLCDAKLLNWVRLGGRDGTTVVLCCKICLAKVNNIVWDEVLMRNLFGLRELYPAQVKPPETPYSVGANYKTRNGPEVLEFKSRPGVYFVEIGPGKYAEVEEKSVIFPV